MIEYTDSIHIKSSFFFNVSPVHFVSIKGHASNKRHPPFVKRQEVLVFGQSEVCLEQDVRSGGVKVDGQSDLTL